MRASERLRDSRGRFVKEQEAEASRSLLPAQLRQYGAEAADRLRAIADDPETPPKLRADIEKFFFEAVYGKGGKLTDGEEKAPAVIKFEGELKEWSE